MKTVLQSFVANRQLLIYIVGLSILRGLLFPDFRYGSWSVAVIQVAYPLLLLAPLLIGKVEQFGFITYFSIGFAGIVTSQIVAMARYWFDAGREALFDSVTIAVFLASFVAVVVLYGLLILALALSLKR